MSKTIKWLDKNKKVDLHNGSICTFDNYEGIFVTVKISKNDPCCLDKIREIFEAMNGEGIRYCSVCGKPMDEGYTNEEYYCCSDECFEKYMNAIYGKGEWYGSDDYNCYMTKDEVTGELFDTGWYHTEWY